MCFGPSATSASSRRRLSSLRKSPPRIVAALDLQKSGERRAMDTLHGYTTGPRKIWRVLAMRRDAEALRVAVEWPRRRSAPMFARVSIAFLDGSVLCLFKNSEKAARAALAAAGGEG